MQTGSDIKVSVQESYGSAAQPRRDIFVWYLLAAYINQGVSQHFCLPAQPLDFYLLKQMHFSAVEVAAFLSVLMVPWLIKPIYGILSDFVPIGGWHKKPYLLLGAAVGAAAFGCLAFGPPAFTVLPLLLSCSLGMAISTVVLVALVTDRSHKMPELARKYFSLQATSYYGASIGASLVGGMLCQQLAPRHALSVACSICAVFCLLAFFASASLDEPRTAPRKNYRGYLQLMKATVCSFRFRSVACFIFFWNLSPSFGTPLYFYFTKQLMFSQEFIGRLGAVNSLGMLAGSLVFRFLARRMPLARSQAGFSIVIGILSNLSYLFCDNQQSAVVLEFFRGVAQMIGILTIYGVAADVCPRKIAATTFGVLIAINNAGTQLGTLAGAGLFTYACNNSIKPLSVISAIFTAVCFVAVYFLPRTPTASKRAVQ